MNRLAMRIFGAGVAALAGLAGCNGNTPVASSGTLTLGLADAPVDDADAVVVSFSAVELLVAQGGVARRIEFSPAASVDLLAQQGGLQFLLLDGRDVEARTYSEIRLIVADQTNSSCNAAQANPDHPSYITIDGVDYPLIIPGGGSSGLELSGPIEVVEGQDARYTVDFDLRKSIVERGSTGCYNLKPKLRLVETAESGILSGSVDDALLADDDCTADPVTGEGAAVYVFAGSNVDPDDDDNDDEGEDNGGPDPVSTALLVPVTQGGNTVSFNYAAGFLPPGNYTVALSCEAGDDAPDSDDDIEFQSTGNATIVSGQTTDFDF